MFDFIEEDLASQQKESEQKNEKEAAPEAFLDPVVYSMPEKFRHTLKKGGMGPMIIAASIGGILLLGTIGAAVYFFVLQPQAKVATEQQKQEPPKKEEPKPEELKKEEPPPVEEPKPEEPKTPVFTPGPDTDKDLVSDLEERVYKTDSEKSDTDGDNYSDNTELENLYDPTHGDSAALLTSGIVSTYQNKDYNYSFLYPAAFTVNVVNQTAREIMVAGASTGEFFSIKVEENPNKLSPADWYASLEKGIDISTLQSFERDTWTGVVSKDGLTVYLTPKKGAAQEKTEVPPFLYVIHYDLNKKTESNLLVTFQVLLKSFVFGLTTQPQRSDGNGVPSE